MDKLYEIVQASAALDGVSLSREECDLLLSRGVSSAGKTIAEQLLCLDLRDAYEQCRKMAARHEFWSIYRLKSIASIALRHTPDGDKVQNERALLKVCEIANMQRLHISEGRSLQAYRASFDIHYLISLSRPWGDGSNRLGRLLMNYLQLECRLEPTVVQPSQRKTYKHMLDVALREEIGEVLVSYMMEHRCDKPEAPAEAPPAPAAKRSDSAKTASRPSSREAILALLKEHPYRSTRDLAEQIGISAKGIEKQIGILKAAGTLRRVGPDKGGHWEVIL